jgi:hypothetical protein
MKEAEKGVDNLHLIIAFHRGELYLEMKKDKDKDVGVKKWFNKTIRIPYPTARRYMAFALLVKSFPRLMVCDLKFSDIMQHFPSICMDIKKDMMFAASLKKDVEFYAQGKFIKITPKDITPPTFKENIGADIEYHEQMEADNDDAGDANAGGSSDKAGGSSDKAGGSSEIAGGSSEIAGTSSDKGGKGPGINKGGKSYDKGGRSSEIAGESSDKDGKTSEEEEDEIAGERLDKACGSSDIDDAEDDEEDDAEDGAEDDDEDDDDDKFSEALEELNIGDADTSD